MTYRRESSRDLTSEQGRIFEVSKVRMSASGHVMDVLWSEVNTATGLDVGGTEEVSAAEVIEAIHDGAEVVALFEASDSRPRKRAFNITLQPKDGEERIGFDESQVPGRELADMSQLDPLDENLLDTGAAMSETTTVERGLIHAVSKVRLDADGRITEVFWGKVDPVRNDWATAEVVAPVEQAVDALLAGHQVFALFPSLHGHMPDREFVVADYDGNRRTIVLAGPTAYEREVHDMDRLAAQG